MRPVIVFLFLSLHSAAADPLPVPTANPIRLPSAATPAAPTPATPQTLTADLLFYVDSDIPVMVLSSPAGLVKLTKEAGPLRVRGRFIDDPTHTKTKTYQGKFLYQIEAAKSGLCEILIIPSLDDESKVIRRTLNVVAGEGPLPPPVPPIPPADPILTPFQQKLQAAFTADAAPVSSAKTLAALYRTAAKTTVYDDGIATGAALLAELQTAVKNLGIPHGSMNGTARVIADEINVNFSKITTLDKATRDSIAAEFAMIAASLEVMK